jgi:glycosyltransferase involved in cell wall biosynthesis
VVSAPTVSVIIPNYNHARYLPKRIESVLHQTYEDFEVLLLDDCSTDSSRSVLSRYAADLRVRLEFNSENSGSTFKQWNKGVHLARGEYIWIAESDDYADSALLETLVRVLETDKQITFAYCRSWRANEDDAVTGVGDWHLDTLDKQQWQSDFVMNGYEHCRKYSLRSPVVANAGAAVFRKSAFEGVGGADESFRLCGDWKFWAAMALAGKVAFVNKRLNYFRHHSGTVRSKSAREAFDVMEKLLVIRWVLDQVRPSTSDIRYASEEASNHWVPAVMSLRLPIALKLAILEQAKTIDAHPFCRLPRPALLTLLRKIARQWRSLRSLLNTEFGQGRSGA